MKKIVLIIGILSAVVLTATAQNYMTEQMPYLDMRSQQIIQPGAMYQGTVYEPFSATVPSDQTEVGARYAASRPTNVIFRFPKPGETGQSEAYPLGDAVLPLLLCALVFCFVITRRRKKAE